LGDYLSQPQKYGGLGFGATTTSFIFVGAILATVLFLSITKKDLLGKVPVATKENAVAEPGAIWQVATVLALLLFVSGAGYYWRHSTIQAADSSAAAQVGSANAADPASSTISSGQSSKQPAKSLSPLGDLTEFKTITQDCLNFVNSGDLSGAKTRVDDLEYEWDNSQARLKPMNPAAWTKVDTAVDQVLRQLRAVHQDAASCKSSLEGLLALLG